MNRAVHGQRLCQDFGEYLALERLLARAQEKVPTRLLGYCLMPTHWHLVLWPTMDREMSAFVRWLSMTHARHLRRWRGTERAGAVYQGRFRAVPVEAERYFYTLLRYVERNPVRAGLVERCEDWLWSSASRTPALHGVQLARWPLPRPDGWSAFLDGNEPRAELDLIRHRTQCGEAICQPHAIGARFAILDD